MAVNNKVCILLALCVLAACALADEEKTYSDKYDHIDIGGILKNDRLRNQYFNCFLGAGPCVTPDAKFFKEKFPEAIVTKCKKCTNKQRDGFEKIVIYYSENEPEKWNQVLTKAITDFSLKSKLGKKQ